MMLLFIGKQGLILPWSERKKPRLKSKDAKMRRDTDKADFIEHVFK